MAQYQVNILGFGDNVIDKYEHIKTVYPGGNCVSFAVYAQMFGAERGAYMGYLGNNAEVGRVIHTPEEIGIETMECKQLEGENGCAKTTLVDRDRVFLDPNGGGIRGGTSFALNRFGMEYIRQFDFVHSGNYYFTEAELPKIKAVDAPTPLDSFDNFTEEYYQGVVPSVDYAFCSFDGTDEEAREHLKQMVSYGPRLVVASRGVDGYILYDGKDFYVQKAAPIESVVNTMGAGDSLTTPFMVSYTGHLKKGVTGAVAIRESLEGAVEFMTKICGISGAFSYGKVYE